MRISDWSSDVCSSDLNGLSIRGIRHATYRVVTGTWVRGVCIFDHCSPSNKADACDADSRITPSCARGQCKPPVCTPLLTRPSTVPSPPSSLILFARFARTVTHPPDQGFSESV